MTTLFRISRGVRWSHSIKSVRFLTRAMTYYLCSPSDRINRLHGIFHEGVRTRRHAGARINDNGAKVAFTRVARRFLVGRIRVILRCVPGFLYLSIFISRLRREFRILTSVLPFRRKLLCSDAGFLRSLILNGCARYRTNGIFALYQRLNFRRLLLLRDCRVLLLTRLSILLRLLYLVLLPFLFRNAINTPLKRGMSGHYRGCRVRHGNVVKRMRETNCNGVVFRLASFLSRVVVNFYLRYMFSMVRTAMTSFKLFRIQYRHRTLSSLRSVVRVCKRFVMVQRTC